MGAAERSAALLADVNNYLDRTWEDEAGDRKILGLIQSGMAYLDDKLGEQADYTADGLPRTLLMEYVRYMRDGALDLFESNYQSMILAMQNKRRVQAYAQAQPDEGGQ